MINYSLTGTDQEGNMVVDVRLKPERAAQILLQLIESGDARVGSPVEIDGVLTSEQELDTAVDYLTREDEPPKTLPKTVRGGATPKEAQHSGKKEPGQATVDRAIKLRDDGMSYNQIAAQLGISQTGAFNMLKSAGHSGKRAKKAPQKTELENSNNIGREIQNHYKKPKLSVEIFERVKIALAHEVPHDVIAREIKITTDLVRAVELAKTYADL